MDLILEEFINLYNLCPKMGQLRVMDNQEYRSFKEKVGLPVALCSSRKFMDSLPRYDSFYPYWKENEIFWLIPVDTDDGRIYGFVLRGLVAKQYRNYFLPKRPQALFGFAGFKGFKLGDPIVIVEGSKDCIYWQKNLYPFTLAALTAGISRDILILLKLLTNSLVIAYDNDSAGKKTAKDSIEAAQAAEFKVQQFLPDGQYDWADLFDKAEHKAFPTKRRWEFIRGRL